MFALFLFIWYKKVKFLIDLLFNGWAVDGNNGAWAQNRI
jgi:hypothetical protein